MLNDKRIKSCISRYDNGAYSCIQFLAQVSHSIGAHTEALCLTADSSSSSSSSDEDETCDASPVTTSESSESPATAAAMLMFALKRTMLFIIFLVFRIQKNYEQHSPIVARSLRSWTVAMLCCMNQCQFHCKVILFGDR